MVDDFGSDAIPWLWQSVRAPSAPAVSAPLLRSAGQTDTTAEQTQLPAGPAPNAMIVTTPEPVAVPAQASSLDVAAQRGAGAAVLLAGGGVAAGWLLAGVWGAGAGLLLVGAARNGWRAKELWTSNVPEDREEAAKSATMAAVGGIIGGYLAYRAMRECE